MKNMNGVVPINYCLKSEEHLFVNYFQLFELSSYTCLEAPVSQ